MNGPKKIDTTSNILVVGDKPEGLRLLSTILKRQGHTVRTLPEGSMVVPAVLKQPPDIILLDILMPDMDGYTVCEQLKANERVQDIPVIFISTLDEVVDMIKGFEVGGVDYITKPFHEEEVLARVNTHIALTRSKQEIKIKNKQLHIEITERKEAEVEIIRKAAVLKGVNKILQEALNHKTEEALGETCLSIAEELTGSKFGFIGEIGPDGLFHDIAISNPGWEACNIIDPQGHRRPPGNFQIHGLYGRVLKQGKSFFTNDPASHPDKVGLPKGHPSLTSFLGVPLIQKGRIIGMVAVGNRTDGYSEREQKSLDELSPSIVEAFMSLRAEEALRESEEKFRSLYSAMNEGVCLHEIIYDEGDKAVDYTILDINPAYESILGLKRQDVIGKRATDVYGSEQAPYLDIYTKVADTGNHTVFETYYPPMKKHFSISVFSPSKGKFATVFKDITEGKKAEEKLRDYAESQLVLVREVNHRVMNNLSAIISMLHKEEDRAQAEGMSSYLPVLSDLVGRVEGLSAVHSLLSESGWRPLKTNELCEQVIKAALQGLPLNKHMHLNIQPSSCRINSNQSHHLTLVLNELATNSIKHALQNQDTGNIFVDIEEQNNNVLITFKDDGPGYPEAILKGDYRSTSIGFELIIGIVTHSLSGEVSFRNDNGAVAVIMFENELKSDH